MFLMASSAIPAKNGNREISLTVQVWKEGSSHVAYNPELDVSSCGKTPSQAKTKLKEAVSLFLEEASRMGTLDEILAESGFERRGKIYKQRPILVREKLRLAIPAT